MFGQSTPRLSLSSAVIAVAMLQTRITEAGDARQTQRGASMVEYGMLLMLVFIVAVVTLGLFGDTLVGVFQSSSDAFEDATGVTGG